MTANCFFYFLFFLITMIRYNETLQDWNDPEVLEIPHWLNGIIISALAMSIICNICVLFRFLEWYVYHSVILSLITATIQGTVISWVYSDCRHSLHGIEY